MKSLNYLNYSEIKESKQLEILGHVLFQDAQCDRINAEVFQRYTDILTGQYPNFKGEDYDMFVREFIDLKERLQSLHSQQDDDKFEEYNEFAKDQCKVLYSAFLNKAFDSEL